MRPINDRKAPRILNAILTVEGTLAEFKDFLMNSFTLNGMRVKRNKLIRAVEILEENVFLKDDTEGGFMPEDYYLASFGERKFNPNSVNTELSQLLEILYFYLAIKFFTQDESFHGLYIARAFDNYYPQYDGYKLMNDLLKKLVKTEDGNAEFFLAQHEMLYNLAPIIQKNSKKFANEYWAQLNDTIDLYYYLKKLEFATGILIHNFDQDEEVEVPDVEWIINRIYEKGWDLQGPTILKGVFHSYMIYTSPDANHHFDCLRTMLSEKDFSALNGERSDYLSFLNNALNHCMLRLDSGDEDIPFEANAMFDLGIISGFFNPDHKILFRHFKNMCTVKCRIGKIEEAEALFNQFQGCISDDSEGHGEMLVKGLITYHKQDYQSALKVLRQLGQLKIRDRQIKFDRSLFEILCRIELVEEEGIEPILASIAAFKRRVKRHHEFKFVSVYEKIIKLVEDYFKAWLCAKSERLKRFEIILHDLMGQKNPYKFVIIDRIVAKS